MFCKILHPSCRFPACPIFYCIIFSHVVSLKKTSKNILRLKHICTALKSLCSYAPQDNSLENSPIVMQDLPPLLFIFPLTRFNSRQLSYGTLICIYKNSISASATVRGDFHTRGNEGHSGWSDRQQVEIYWTGLITNVINYSLEVILERVTLWSLIKKNK